MLLAFFSSHWRNYTWYYSSQFYLKIICVAYVSNIYILPSTKVESIENDDTDIKVWQWNNNGEDNTGNTIGVCGKMVSEAQ